MQLDLPPDVITLTKFKTTLAAGFESTTTPTGRIMIRRCQPTTTMNVRLNPQPHQIFECHSVELCSACLEQCWKWDLKLQVSAIKRLNYTNQQNNACSVGLTPLYRCLDFATLKYAKDKNFWSAKWKNQYPFLPIESFYSFANAAHLASLCGHWLLITSSIRLGAFL